MLGRNWRNLGGKHYYCPIFMLLRNANLSWPFDLKSINDMEEVPELDFQESFDIQVRRIHKILRSKQMYSGECSAPLWLDVFVLLGNKMIS